MTRPLYDRAGIVIASFFGTVVTGGILMYLNERQLGRQRGTRHVAVSAAILVIGVGIGFLLPEGFPTFPLTLAQLFTFVAYFKREQGEILDEHQALDGPIESRWKAFGISLVGLLLFVGVTIAFLAVAGQL